VGRKHEGLDLGRSRCLGGTTNLWGGQLVEFQPIDFDGRDWLPDSKWPVAYEEIQPYYARTYENLGIEREVQEDQRVFQRFLGSQPQFAEGLEVFLTRWLKIPSFSVMYKKEIESSEDLRVLLDHTVVGFSGSNGRITGIRVADRDGMVQVVEGDCFVLAAGTIEIARLLLHAAATPDWECPWRENRNVGAYFQDHLGGPIASVQASDKPRFFKIFTNIVWEGHKYQPKLRLTNATQEQSQTLNVQAVFSFDSSIRENLVYLKQFLKAAIYSRKISGVGDFFRNLRGCGKYLIPLMWKYVVDKRVFEPGKSRISLVVQSEQMPTAGSRILIDPTQTGANGLPKVILDWKLGSRELQSIRDFALRCSRAMESAGLARLQLPEDLMNLEPRFLETLHDTYHQSGGARMGVSAQDGVVDRNLRVFGTENLYVAGAAVFRTNSNANTTFTALAFVTRLVDHLLSREMNTKIESAGTRAPGS
jgi:choline dehydrogenase-like flavoprotein